MSQEQIVEWIMLIVFVIIMWPFSAHIFDVNSTFKKEVRGYYLGTREFFSKFKKIKEA